MNIELPPFLYVNSPSTWQQCLDALHAASRLAIDLESNSLYAYREQICLIQISTETRDFVIEPLAQLDFSPLGRIMADPAVEKVFHAAEYDLILMTREHGWELNSLFDTMWAARILGIQKIGLANLLSERYGVKLDKKFQRANWCQRPLTDDQLRYAQADTHFLLRLRDALAQELREAGCEEESAEIFIEQSRVKLPDTSFDPEGFWTINGVRHLEPRQQAIFRELVLFREREAEKRNRPPFKILSNKTLLEVAELAPRHAGQLAPVHGMTHSQIRRYGNGVLQAVAAGKRASLPKRQRNDRRTPDDVLNRYDHLQEWRKLRARKRGVPSDVVLYRDTLWEIAYANPQSVEALAAVESLGPWRRRTYGPDIVRVVQKANASEGK